MAKRKKPIKPIHEVDEIKSAHEVRLLRTCHRCGGFGFVTAMVGFEEKLYHPQCYLKKFGFKSVLTLPLSEMKKYRFKDLTTPQMIRLLELLGIRKKPH
jgi:hypothetical protein